MEPNQEKEEVKDPDVERALEEGRNANDNFNNSDVDDYGVERGTEEGAEELRERQQIKGGTGQHGTERNRNDDFKEKEP